METLTQGQLHWLRRNLLWHLSFDGETFICGSIVEGRPRTAPLGEVPQGNLCKSCQRKQAEALGL